jgi:hypothetical protein
MWAAWENIGFQMGTFYISGVLKVPVVYALVFSVICDLRGKNGIIGTSTG